ncbi:MAG: glycosyltransferase family 2 protein [Candidatus Sericytochromatia bacterium]|nr:glycosyltransferase family 2 protein [Candidatus Sericytochromatia bacterium]
MRTSIVIPVHNQLACTQICLAALDQTLPVAETEIIVVDNGSTDGTAAWLQRQVGLRTNLLAIRSAANLGFAGGCNLGLAAASGDGVVLLNNDAIVSPGWLQGLWAPLLQQPALGMTGPVSNFVIREQVVAGPKRADWAAVSAYAAEIAQAHSGQGRPTERLSGFCLLIRRAVITRLGGLDPRFGLAYYEDDDYCLRADLAGFGLWIAQDVYVHHLGQRTATALGIADGRFDENWHRFRLKWGLPPDRPIEAGWRRSDILPRHRLAAKWYFPLPPVS